MRWRTVHLANKAEDTMRKIALWAQRRYNERTVRRVYRKRRDRHAWSWFRVCEQGGPWDNADRDMFAPPSRHRTQKTPARIKAPLKGASQ